ncbi:15664_t:CDS:2 [Acaulospora morrowiae]|uniref:15664_t:CDS:1 n=1 Tax=Acaulospora morrowiae TaxID=94023 RepID=A0A9N8VT18_9GLOM|nr:15664_t:CDS:2 [Acaulospora morrowiae]
MSTLQETKPENRIHGRFSVQEDSRLLDYVRKHGARKWSKVAAHVGTRDPKQCRERYMGHLAPEVNKDPFTEEELKKICELVQKGYKWAEIARKLGNGRIPNNVKNVWNQKLRKLPSVVTERTIKKSPIRRTRGNAGSLSSSVNLSYNKMSSDQIGQISDNSDIQLTPVNSLCKRPEKNFNLINTLEDKITNNTSVSIQLPSFLESFDYEHPKEPQFSLEITRYDKEVLRSFSLD